MKCTRSRNYKSCSTIMLFWIFCKIFFIISIVFIGAGGILDKRQHQTNASMEKMNDLTCYRCNTMNNGKCNNVSLLMNVAPNAMLQEKCKGDKKTCMVKRYSYSTSNENSTTQVKMWSLERSCTNKCENGCIVIGERTKLYACTACCSTNLCNISNKANTVHLHKWLKIIISVGLMIYKSAIRIKIT